MICIMPYVIDGDTIVCEQSQVHIRIWGIDAPEIAHPRYGKYVDQPGGQAARIEMQHLVAKGMVRCEEADRRRSYGRTVARCYVGVNGEDVGAHMLLKRYACEWMRYDHSYYSWTHARICNYQHH